MFNLEQIYSMAFKCLIIWNASKALQQKLMLSVSLISRQTLFHNIWDASKNLQPKSNVVWQPGGLKSKRCIYAWEVFIAAVTEFLAVWQEPKIFYYHIWKTGKPFFTTKVKFMIVLGKKTKGANKIALQWFVTVLSGKRYFLNWFVILRWFVILPGSDKNE